MAVISGCSSYEVDRVQREVVYFDESPALTIGEGLKVAVREPLQAIIYRVGKDPQPGQVAPGTYVLMGVNSFNRARARQEALIAIKDRLAAAVRSGEASASVSPADLLRLIVQVEQSFLSAPDEQ